jgi:hypothetical protein
MKGIGPAAIIGKNFSALEHSLQEEQQTVAVANSSEPANKE